MPPAPAWKEKPSFMIPASRRKRATYSAMSSRSGLLVICVVPETILAGSPMESTTTTESTLLPWICQGMHGKGTRLSVTTMTWSAYMRVGQREAQRPAGGRPVGAVGVAKGVGGGRRDDGDVDVHLAVLHRLPASAVGAQHAQAAHASPCDVYSPSGPFMLPSMWCTTPWSHEVHDGRVAREGRAGEPAQVLHAHARGRLERLERDDIAVAQVVVRGDGHAVAQAHLLQRRLQVRRPVCRRPPGSRRRSGWAAPACGRRAGNRPRPCRGSGARR